MFGPIRQVVFDFDGTLVNTMPSIIKGLGMAARLGSGKEISDHELVKSFGAAPSGVLAKWMPSDQVPAALKHWEDFQATLAPAEIAPFEGIPEMLAALKTQSVRLAIFTGRDRATAEKIIRAHGWWETYFDADTILAGDDGFPVKPQSEGLAQFLKKLSFDPTTTLMVGDHEYDALAGRGAGCKTAAALWDLPAGQGTQRSRFREAWTKWEKIPVDLRLVAPGSLLEWLARPV